MEDVKPLGIGDIVHNQKFGYGVLWRKDRYGRSAARFQSGKEIGGFSDQDLRMVDKEEIEVENVMDVLKQAGLDDHVKGTGSSPGQQAKIEDLERNQKVFQEMLKNTQEFIQQGTKKEKIIEKNIELVEESDIDNFTKQKIKKRISRIKDIRRLNEYLSNSMKRFEKLNEQFSLTKFNITLSEVIKSFENMRS